jgi:hypothetical protein
MQARETSDDRITKAGECVNSRRNLSTTEDTEDTEDQNPVVERF